MFRRTLSYFFVSLAILFSISYSQDNILSVGNADIVAGEMNKQSKQFITELGKTHSKTTVTEVESTLINIIKNTPVRGYEIWKQDVTLTKNGYYRAWIGMRLPLGEYNKMYNYTIEQAMDAYNVKEKADIAFKKVLEQTNDNNGIQQN